MIFHDIKVSVYNGGIMPCYSTTINVANIIYNKRSTYSSKTSASNYDLCNDLILYGYFCSQYFGITGGRISTFAKFIKNTSGSSTPDSLNTEYLAILSSANADLANPTNNKFNVYRFLTNNYKNDNTDSVSIDAYSFDCSSTCTLYVYLKNGTNDWTNYSISNDNVATYTTSVDSNNRYCIKMEFAFKNLCSLTTFNIVKSNNSVNSIVYSVSIYGLSYAYTIARKYNGDANYENLVNMMYCLYKLGNNAASN